MKKFNENVFEKSSMTTSGRQLSVELMIVTRELRSGRYRRSDAVPDPLGLILHFPQVIYLHVDV